MPGYAKRRSDWVAYTGNPSDPANTKIRESDLDAWETALYQLKYLEYNVEDYGVGVGQGSASVDTAALQAAASAAIAAKGKLIYKVPLQINSTVNLVPPSGSQFTLGVEARGDFASLLWTGGNSTSIFKSYGWKMSSVSGVKIRLQAAASGVIGFDVDHDATRSSTGVMSWKNCHVTANGAQTGCIGWRYGHSAGAEFSVISHELCTAQFNETSSQTGYGWVMEQNNGLVVSWDTCGTVGAAEGWTTRQTSGAALTAGAGTWLIKNSSCSYNANDLYLSAVTNCLVSGGRFELGRQFLIMPYNTAGPTVKFDTVEIADYTPNEGGGERLFEIDAGQVIMDNCSLLRAASDYSGSAIQINNGTTGVILQIRGGRFRCSDPFVLSVNPTLDRVVIKNAFRVNGSGVVTGMFDNSRVSNSGTVASATTLTLPVGTSLVTVTGTTTITSIVAKWAGERVTLVFSGALTLTDGSNLKLAGNFVTTADDTISLICDGTNWIETARSVN